MLPKKLPRAALVVRLCGQEMRRAPLCRAFSCAEEDSNLHPVIPDQALSLVGPGVDPFKSCRSVQIVWSRGRHGASDDLDVATDVATPARPAASGAWWQLVWRCSRASRRTELNRRPAG